MTDSDAELLARLSKEYEEADDRGTVLQRWLLDYPQLAAEFIGTLETEILVRNAEPGGEAGVAARLGDFRILRVMGTGGMGIVYEALQEPLQRRVAVKTIRYVQVPEVLLRRFLREQAVLAQLHHTHIVPIYAAGREGATHYFAMQYIDGVSLLEVIRRLRCLPPDSVVPALAELAAPDPPSTESDRQESEPAGGALMTEEYFRAVATWMAEVGDAIASAHSQGVTHRDLKPENLMVDRTGQVWVVDFGLADIDWYAQAVPEAAPAAPDGQLSEPGAVLGTPPYMAPEQLDGKATEVTDVWGIGGVLYELLTLRRAYEMPPSDGSLDANMRRRSELQSALVPARALVPQMPRDLDAICNKCLQKKPTARYATVHALADDLGRYLRGEETRARPYSLLERPIRWGRRHPTRAVLVAIAFALMLLAVLMAGQVADARFANARAAQKLARATDRQLQLLQDAVRDAASPEGKAPADNLVALLKDFNGRPDDLQQSLQRTKKSFESGIKWFKRPGEDLAFVNWFVMNADGDILTDAGPRSVRGNYSDRDYARLLQQSDNAKRVYFSRVFRSEQDGKYKFAAAMRIEDGGRLLGLLAATVAIDSRLVALDFRDEPPNAAVVSPMDWSRNGLSDGRRPTHVLVLSADYDNSGERPEWVEDDLAGPLRSFEQDATRTEATLPWTSDGGFVDYARVGDSNFVVMVRSAYPRPLNWLMRREGFWCLVGVSAACVCFAASRWLRRRVRRFS